MAQIFKPNANAIIRVSIITGILLIIGIILTMVAIYRSTYYTEVGVAKAQSVPFSHKHHVSELKIDCRYCHATVERAAFAGIPTTDTCMSCHSQIWLNSPLLETVRESYRTGEPVQWSRIYDLPDFVYFNHSIHVNKGVGCNVCHGQVDQMQLVSQAQPLYMGWCLDCHRNPEQYVRPREEVFNMEWAPPENQLEMGRRLVQEYEIKVENLSDCYICHR